MVAILTAATLVVGVTLAATTHPAAFAYLQNKPGHDDKKDKARDGDGNENGNTITALIAKNKGYASGFDTTVNQEAGNTICTHPSTDASCVSEGATVSPVGNQTNGGGEEDNHDSVAILTPTTTHAQSFGGGFNQGGSGGSNGGGTGGSGACFGSSCNYGGTGGSAP
jgi:hypothetical protein